MQTKSCVKWEGRRGRRPEEGHRLFEGLEGGNERRGGGFFKAQCWQETGLKRRIKSLSGDETKQPKKARKTRQKRGFGRGVGTRSQGHLR